LNWVLGENLFESVAEISINDSQQPGNSQGKEKRQATVLALIEK